MRLVTELKLDVTDDCDIEKAEQRMLQALDGLANPDRDDQGIRWVRSIYARRDTMEIEDRRLKLALEACEPDRLDRQHADKNMTVDILLCDLQRIHQILSGERYYDYEAQEWVEALVPQGISKPKRRKPCNAHGSYISRVWAEVVGRRTD